MAAMSPVSEKLTWKFNYEAGRPRSTEPTSCHPLPPAATQEYLYLVYGFDLWNFVLTDEVWAYDINAG